MSTARIHGGTDALGTPRWDFSTNANACGPCPLVQQAVRNADATHYPDPHYAVLRSALADFHGVAPARVLLLASASEGIQRLTAWTERRGGQRVHWPEHAYGDYAQAASAWGLQPVALPALADLVWVCEPSSPQGQGTHALRALWNPVLASTAVWVLDRAYEPLRLSGKSAWDGVALSQVWQLWTPNKALGLTGVRGAYAIAPTGAESVVEALEALGPSWPLGAHAVAMLQAWTHPDVQVWLHASLDTLRAWKSEQVEQLQAMGWQVTASDANFFVAQPPEPINAERLRAEGIKLRDATSFGLPGQWRISVQPPAAVAALLNALQTTHGRGVAPSLMEEIT
ncbi:MAG TPA: aminotransferase class I/II-fold pyridoxal phosphate-dependent enzyme [Macromonas sp.]|nr:aminotransferase class I/II-fold pyridoxal phosphate-dependent enzyme [Macromonas sp.]